MKKYLLRYRDKYGVSEKLYSELWMARQSAAYYAAERDAADIWIRRLADDRVVGRWSTVAEIDEIAKEFQP